MGAVFLLLFGIPALLFLGLALAQALEGASNNKGKKRKIRLMKEHPDIAREIWQSIEAQDENHRAKMDALNNTVKKALDVKRKPRKPSVALKIRVALARRMTR